MSEQIKTLFNEYEKKYHALEKTYLQKTMPRSLRLFNIRFRLALDYSVDFSGEYSLTKTPDVKKTYQKIFKLTELWNSYEAFTAYAKQYPNYLRKHQKNERIPPFLKLSDDSLKESGADLILIDATKKIIDHYQQEESNRKNLDEYFKRLNDNKGIFKNLKQRCMNLKQTITASGVIVVTDLLAIMYAERNLYFHAGETAPMGGTYTQRQWLLDVYIAALSEFTLKMAAYVFEKQAAASTE